jgi:hypothetical protein
MTDDYDPATRPPGDIPSGDRVRFEREGEHEQSIWGGGAQDIEQSVLNSSERNLRIIGWTITGVTDVVGDLGAGSLQSLTFILQHSNGREQQLKIDGIGLHVEVIG